MGRESFATTLVRRLNRTTNAHPALGLRLAALAGFLLGPRLGDPWWPSAAELEELVGGMDHRRLERLRRRIAAGELRNRAVISLLHRRGPEPLSRLITLRGADAFRRLRDDGVPVVVVFWHLGVIRAVETALAALGCPLLTSTNRPPRGQDPGYRRRVVSDPASATLFLMEALKEVKRAGVPVLALDGLGSKRRAVPCFGRSFPVPAGPGALAGRGGARIVPATSRWLGLSPRVEVTLHEPLPRPAQGAMALEEWEFEMAGSAVTWFERHLRGHPEDLRLVNVRNLLSKHRAHPRAPREEDFARLAAEFEASEPG